MGQFRRKSLAPLQAHLGGSRFSCLGGLVAETDRLEGLDAAHVAVQAALEVVVDRSVSDAVVDKPSSPHRPSRSDQELIQDFWVDVGYPRRRAGSRSDRRRLTRER